jgi:hypothetical protein
LKFQCQTCSKQFIYPTERHTTNNGTELIDRLCPFCSSLEFDDAPAEPVQSKGKITALVSAPNSEVNKYIADGYEVLEDKIYAKETVLVKRVEAAA